LTQLWNFNCINKGIDIILPYLYNYKIIVMISEGFLKNDLPTVVMSMVIEKTNYRLLLYVNNYSRKLKLPQYI